MKWLAIFPALKGLFFNNSITSILLPHIRFHFFSGDGYDVSERLDRGLLDFGTLIEPIDLSKYDSLRLPRPDIWGLLMRKDHPLAQKEAGCSFDLLPSVDG